MSHRGYSKLYVAAPEEELRRKRPRYFPLYSAITYTAIISILINLFFVGYWAVDWSQTCIRPQLVYSPAISAIQYEAKRLTRDIKHNPFAGKPRPDLDKAWHSLIEPMVIKISEPELSHLGGEKSIAFADGTGYIAEMAVYHELHCIKRIRRHLAMEYYYPNMTEEDRRLEGPHIDHCLEYWREAAMCRGDTTLSTFRWGDGMPFSTVWSIHECVNWDKLDNWARRRMVNLDDYSMLDQSL